MPAGFQVGDHVKVVKQAEYEGVHFPTPEVGTRWHIGYFLDGKSGRTYPCLVDENEQGHWMTDESCLELDEPIDEAEVQEAIRSILSPKEDT